MDIPETILQTNEDDCNHVQSTQINANDFILSPEDDDKKLQLLSKTEDEGQKQEEDQAYVICDGRQVEEELKENTVDDPVDENPENEKTIIKTEQINLSSPRVNNFLNQTDYKDLA